MGAIKREVDFRVHTDEGDEDVTVSINTTTEKLDQRLAEKHDKIAKSYGVDPDDVEIKAVHVVSLWGEGKHYTPLNQR